MDEKEKLLRMLKKYSYRKGEFTLASGKKSDFFIDCKKTTLSATGHKLCGEVILSSILFSILGRREISNIAAVPLGACPLASAVSVTGTKYGMFFDVVYVRPARKDHGTKQRIEAPATHDGVSRLEVILIEDVVTTGGSSLKVARTLKEHGYSIFCVIALVDRLEGAKENLEAEGIPLRSIFTRNDFV